MPEYTYDELKNMAVAIFKTGAKKPDDLIGLLSISNEMYEYDAVRSRQMMIKVRQTAQERCRTDVKFFDVYNEALRLLARKCKDFDAYMLYVEKNRDPSEMFYLPRRKCLMKLGIIQQMQKLLDDELDILSISMPPGTGKEQPLYSKISTPDGYKYMGDIKVGDTVYSGLGGDELSTVIGVFPQGIKPVYEITLESGVKCRCGLDHLWYVMDKHSYSFVANLRQILEYQSLGEDFRIPVKDGGYESIRSICLVDETQCQCIYVDHPSHLYVTDDGIITHNTSLGEFFMSFVMGHYPNTPNLMSSHSGYMTNMFYRAVLNIIKSNEYCWREVFPKVPFESTNAKEETINLGRWQPFQTLTCRPIRASLTGVTRCEGFLYCDDLVSGIEEALSKERLDKLFGEYTTDLKSRKKMLAKEIHISTRWSVHDVIGRIERQYEGSDRVSFIAIPDIDPTTGESNFNYDYNVGFDTKYFEDMAATMDDVSYRCLFKSDPIEREGLLYHPEELRRYLGGLPDKEPDAILAVCDTKDTGLDYNALGVFYQYGQNYYMEDVVFKNIDPGTLDQLNSDMLVKHGVQECQFESNKEGSRTAVEVEKLIKEKGGRCHVTKKYSTQNKETKIIVNSSWVKEHVYFKDPTEYDNRSDYGLFMSNVCSYTQLGKNKTDDAPDMLAMFALFVDNLYGSQVEVIKRTDLGF